MAVHIDPESVFDILVRSSDRHRCQTLSARRDTALQYESFFTEDVLIRLEGIKFFVQRFARAV